MDQVSAAKTNFNAVTQRIAMLCVTAVLWLVNELNINKRRFLIFAINCRSLFLRGNTHAWQLHIMVLITSKPHLIYETKAVFNQTSVLTYIVNYPTICVNTLSRVVVRFCTSKSLVQSLL